MTTLIERLRQYNPPDRTFDEQRQMSVDIHVAADELERLTAEVARLQTRMTTQAIAESVTRDSLMQERDQLRAEVAGLQERLTLAETVRAAQVEGLTKGLDARRIVDEMDAVAIKHAHRMALDLECVLSDYNGKWWDAAIQTLGEYREAMNAIHERESPTHMGEPVLQHKNCDRPDCPAGGYGPCAPCEREHSGG